MSLLTTFDITERCPRKPPQRPKVLRGGACVAGVFLYTYIGALLLTPSLDAAEAAPSAKSPPAAREETLELPSGTLLSVELVDPVASGKSKSGDLFRARVNEGVYVRGALALPPGSTVRGTVVEAVPSGRLRGRSKLELTLSTLDLDGSSYSLRTDTLSYAGEGHAGSNFGSLFGGALQGALYGVLFGGEKGAVIGAGAGAAAGGASKVLSGKQDVEFPQGAKLMFETTAPTRLPAPPPQPAAGPAVEGKPSPAPPQEKPVEKPEPKPEEKAAQPAT